MATTIHQRRKRNGQPRAAARQPAPRRARGVPSAVPSPTPPRADRGLRSGCWRAGRPEPVFAPSRREVGSARARSATISPGWKGCYRNLPVGGDAGEWRYLRRGRTGGDDPRARLDCFIRTISPPASPIRRCSPPDRLLDTGRPRPAFRGAARCQQCRDFRGRSKRCSPPAGASAALRRGDRAVGADRRTMARTVPRARRLSADQVVVIVRAQLVRITG